MRKFNHVGIPTPTQKECEIYVEGMKLFLTDFSKSANKIEFLRFESGSTMPEILKTHAHIAYEVPSLESAMEGKKVVLEPFQGGEGLMCAFIEEEGIAIELMCFDNKQTKS
jgi:hypothetical protein